MSVNGSVSTASVNGSVTVSGNGPPSSTGPPVRELNYAELDLPKSNAIGFPQTVRQNGSTNKQPTLLNGSAAAVSFSHWAKHSCESQTSHQNAGKVVGLPLAILFSQNCGDLQSRN